MIDKIQFELLTSIFPRDVKEAIERATELYISEAKSDYDKRVRMAIANCDFIVDGVSSSVCMNTMEGEIIITIRRPFS